MNLYTISQQRGTTLLECLIGIVLIGIVSASLYTIFNFGAQSWMLGQDNAEDQQTLRVAIHRLSRTISMASQEEIFLFSNSDIFVGSQRFRLIGTDLRNENFNPIASGINYLDFTKMRVENGLRYEVANNSTQWDLLRISIKIGDESGEYITYIKPRN